MSEPNAATLPFYAEPAPRREAEAGPDPRPLGARPLPWRGPKVWFGVARVEQLTADGLPVVRLGKPGAGLRVAEWALPYRFEAEVGDQLRVVASAGRCYVLSVAQGKGQARLWFRGDLRLRVKGVLRLAADRRLRIRAKDVALRAGQSLEVVAHAVHEKLERATRVVSGLLEEHSQDSLRVTEGQEALIAKRVQVIAEDKVSYDAERILVQ